MNFVKLELMNGNSLFIDPREVAAVKGYSNGAQVTLKGGGADGTFSINAGPEQVIELLRQRLGGPS